MFLSFKSAFYSFSFGQFSSCLPEWTPCSLVQIYRRFRGTGRFHSSSPTMHAASTVECYCIFSVLYRVTFTVLYRVTFTVMYRLTFTVLYRVTFTVIYLSHLLYYIRSHLLYYTGSHLLYCTGSHLLYCTG